MPGQVNQCASLTAQQQQGLMPQSTLPARGGQEEQYVGP